MFLGSRGGGIKSNIGFFGACGADRGGGVIQYWIDTFGWYDIKTPVFHNCVNPFIIAMLSTMSFKKGSPTHRGIHFAILSGKKGSCVYSTLRWVGGGIVQYWMGLYS